MKKWIPTIVTIASATVVALQPDLQAWIGAHPTAGMLLAGVYAIIKGLLPSPVVPAK